VETEINETTQALIDRKLIKVLLVEDDEIDRLLVKRALARNHTHIEFATDSAGNLSEAIKCLNTREYDVVLLDLMLPDSLGLETVQKIKKIDSHVPIVVLTRLDDEKAGLYAIKTGAMDYLIKGQVLDNVLIRTIQYAIERNQMQLVLQETNDKLELQVEERTRKLSKTNELLNKEIVERKQIEDALRSSEANLRKVISVSPEGIIILDQNGIINFANSTAESFLDRDSGQLLREKFAFPINLNKATEIEIVREIGEIVTVEMNVAEIDWEKQKAYLVSLHNITERKKSEEKIKEAIEIKSKFVATASHELRTPLTAIKEGIRLAVHEKTGELNDEQKELLSIAKRNVDRLARLINDILDFQKLEAGRTNFNLQENDINIIVKDVYDTMTPAVKRLGLDFILEREDNLPKAKFDSDRIVQVMTNMVSNAMRFTEKGTIKIATSKSENVIQVSVSDTGCGIRRDDQPKVFHEFEQLGQGGDRKTGGAGLGLAISKAIIEQHRGKICVKSEYTKGSTFYFILPIEERRTKERDEFNGEIDRLYSNRKL